MKTYSYVDPNIKKGDKVHIIDGSGLTIDIKSMRTIHSNKDHITKYKTLYIVNSYPGLGFVKILKDDVFTVIETNISNYQSVPHAYVNHNYQLDIKLKHHTSKVILRTCSKFVIKL